MIIASTILKISQSFILDTRVLHVAANMSSLEKMEMRKMCIWYHEVSAQSGLSLTLETIATAEYLLHTYKPSAPNMELIGTGCLFLAMKYIESMGKQLDAQSFLRVFNLSGLRTPMMSPKELVDLELMILKCINYNIPSHRILKTYDPISVVHYYSGVTAFLENSSAALKEQFIQHLLEYDKSIVLQNPSAVILSRLRLCCMIMAVYDCKTPDLRIKMRTTLSTVNGSRQWSSLDTVSRRIALMLLNSAVQLYAGQRKTGLRLLNSALKQGTDIVLLNEDPMAVVLYHPNVTTWLKYTSSELQKVFMQQLLQFDDTVLQQNKTPASLLSRIRLLTMMLAVYGAPAISKVDQKLQELKHCCHWSKMSLAVLPTAQSLIDAIVMMTDDSSFQEGLSLLSNCLHDLKHINLLVDSCY